MKPVSPVIHIPQTGLVDHFLLGDRVEIVKKHIETLVLRARVSVLN
jgi:hypothetical protein